MDLSALAAVPAAVLSATSDAGGGFDPLSLIKDFGFPTAVVIMFVCGFIVTKQELQRTRADLEAERAARVALQSTLTDQVVPALTRSTDAVNRSADLMEAMARRQAGG